MTLAHRLTVFSIAGLAAAFVLQPANRRAAALASQSPEDSAAWLAGQDAQPRAERNQEKQDREQELREREQERAGRQQELYDDGREALDEDRYQQAEDKFSELVSMNGPQTDAALYWKAYAQNRQAKKDSALASIAELKRRFPKSRWLKDAEALQIEVQQSTGQKPNPESLTDNSLKVLALQALLNSDPGRAMPIAQKMLNGPDSRKDKAKVLFMIGQSGSEKGMEVLTAIARGQSNPELQRKAVEYLGMFGSQKSRQALAEVYASTTDASVKRAVLRSYMISGDKQSLFNAAKNEKDESVKREAIRQLGISGGQSELQQLYQTEPSVDVRREILQGFFLAGDSQKLVQAAQSEKDIDLRRTAIRNLGLVGGDAAAAALQSLYAKETDRSLKEEVLNAYFLQGNAKALVAIAKSEKDPELKKVAVQKLSLMGSKEGNDYLMELLEK
jgi:hypothetical protein